MLSTIYCNRDFVTGVHMGLSRWNTWGHRARTGLVLLRSALQGKHLAKCQAYTEILQDLRVAYEMADMLLPNSHSEAAAIVKELGVTTPCHVVPNAVDHLTFQPKRVCDPTFAGCVLYVGRFEPHKNQLGLIQALKGTGLPLVLAGPVHPHHEAYYAECQRHVSEKVTIRPGQVHEDLAPLYRTAKVHVLPSWFETTGLVSLEAALCGCNIVSTNRGYSLEYFGDLVWYCDPADPGSIRRAVESAYSAPPRPELQERILSRYTWVHTAKATLAAYEQALVRSKRMSTSVSAIS